MANIPQSEIKAFPLANRDASHDEFAHRVTEENIKLLTNIIGDGIIQYANTTLKIIYKGVFYTITQDLTSNAGENTIIAISLPSSAPSTLDSAPEGQTVTNFVGLNVEYSTSLRDISSNAMILFTKDVSSWNIYQNNMLYAKNHLVLRDFAGNVL